MRIFSDKLQSPLERAHYAIVVEHREVPLAFVHVAFQHFLIRILTGIEGMKGISNKT